MQHAISPCWTSTAGTTRVFGVPAGRWSRPAPTPASGSRARRARDSVA